MPVVSHRVPQDTKSPGPPHNCWILATICDALREELEGTEGFILTGLDLGEAFAKVEEE